MFAGLLVVLGVAIGACLTSPPPESITLLPAPDGSVGAVIVESKTAGSTLINQAYSVASVKSSSVQTTTSTPDEVSYKYGSVLNARPARPSSIILYFVSGSDQLTPQSLQDVESFKQELAKRPAPEISVIGHTDRVGAVTDNDALSRLRAEKVKSILTAAGIDASTMEIAARGEREPLVPTADEVDEPRNRRVEVNVR